MSAGGIPSDDFIHIWKRFQWEIVNY